jgi:hypothetical protein
MDEILDEIGNRKYISVDEIKHITRLGMGACRGKRCIKRLKQAISKHNIQVIGDATPRGPLSNQLTMGELYPRTQKEKIIVQKEPKKIKTKVVIAGGGIAGSALYRYFAEAGYKPLLLNFDRGASWRNIAGGRPAFTVPEISDIASHNLEIFKELQNLKDIHFRQTRYVTFAHDDATYQALKKSTEWSDAFLIERSDFVKYISPNFNPNLDTYHAALITNNCWQATPGIVIDLLRAIGTEHGGKIWEDTLLLDIEKNEHYVALVKHHDGDYYQIESELFVNALGPKADEFARKLGIETGLYPENIRHSLPDVCLCWDTTANRSICLSIVENIKAFRQSMVNNWPKQDRLLAVLHRQTILSKPIRTLR